MKRILIQVLAAAAFFTMGAAQAATVLVTGSNRGLGLEFVRQYAEAGWTIIATARNPDEAKELKALAAKHKTIAIKQLDVIDTASVNALARDLKGQPIDVLINNAGVLGSIPKQTLGSLDYAEFQRVMAINVFGAMAVSEALRTNVIASTQKKIVAITSGSGIISVDLPGGLNLYYYRASKVALNMAMKGLAEDLRPSGVAVGIIAPGAVDTDMRREVVGAQAAQDLKPETSIAGMRKVIADLSLRNSGKPYNYDGREIPW
jgi:NAD(P)-dependent dehydrogenase (short-subunit alcohol dehydrogenase family)